MKKTVIILALIVSSCKNKPTTDNNPETDLSVQMEDTIDNSLPVPDSTLIRINQIIAEELTARKLEYTFDETTDTTTICYNYDVYVDRKGTGISLTIQTFNSQQSAKQKIRNIQEIKEKEKPFKVTFRYFRINNKLYSLSSTADVEHIQIKIYSRAIEEMQIKEEDTGIW